MTNSHNSFLIASKTMQTISKLQNQRVATMKKEKIVKTHRNRKFTIQVITISTTKNLLRSQTKGKKIPESIKS